MDRRVPRPWGENLSGQYSFMHENAGFAIVADADERRHAVVEHRLALIRIEVRLGIPQPRKDKLPVRPNNLRIGGICLTLASNTNNLVSLNQYLRIANRRAPIAVNERPSLDDN